MAGRKDIQATRPHQRGFTLVELMVTVAVIAIVAAIAVPSFTALINNNRLISTANTINAALQQSRVESIRRNARIVMCSSSNSDSAAATCAGSSTWSGWLVFIDADHDGQPAADDSDVIARGSFKSPVVVQSPSSLTSGTLFFRPDGFSRAQGSTAFLSSFIRVCIPTARPSQNIRDVVISSGSRFAIDSSSGGGACAAP